MTGPLRRIGAMVMRHVYVLRSSWPRLLELLYWPTVQVILWGFISSYMATQTSLLAQAENEHPAYETRKKAYEL